VWFCFSIPLVSVCLFSPAGLSRYFDASFSRSNRRPEASVERGRSVKGRSVSEAIEMTGQQEEQTNAMHQRIESPPLVSSLLQPQREGEDLLREGGGPDDDTPIVFEKYVNEKAHVFEIASDDANPNLTILNPTDLNGMEGGGNVSQLASAPLKQDSMIKLSPKKKTGAIFFVFFLFFSFLLVANSCSEVRLQSRKIDNVIVKRARFAKTKKRYHSIL
jgi:hypothetical protein